ncbi:hypothetical protein ACRXCV_08590 [Halobacteriovorax sp. GFR7]|uniref:hypothetical protein n=1 Tax=unclassified Halobacteriovorax TaxID=2639665 RepID=UPI0037230E9F
MSSQLSKQDLYESVKTLVESDASRIHLGQHKLYTLFSVAFQYMLFKSTKEAGAYIIRVQDAKLAQKLARKSKDESTRKFLTQLQIPRKIKYGKSTFYLDFFNIASWNITRDINPANIKGSLIVRDTSEESPVKQIMALQAEAAMNEAILEGQEDAQIDIPELPEDFYFTHLVEAAPKNILIAFDEVMEEGLLNEYNFEAINFPFIKKEIQKTISGVTISKDLDWDNIDD